MICLHLTTRAPNGSTVRFTLSVDDLELALETVNMFVNHEHIALEAIIEEDGLQLVLPLSAFDGNPIGVHLLKLQQEWQQLLGE
jgi:hypothetical protein